jgi:cellulose synthase/poly-beta-1,6-N-acetylglucosamine synthase-like glycosyltransferase
MFIIITLLVKAVGIAYRTIGGRNQLEKAQKVDWSARLADLENPEASYEKYRNIASKDFSIRTHLDNLRLMTADPKLFPHPSQIYNAVIVVAYNEPIEIIEPTIQTLADTHYDKSHLIVVFGYEERGGPKIKAIAEQLQTKFKSVFKEFKIVEHPKDLQDEVIGKGANLCYGAEWLKSYLVDEKIPFENVIVTSLDCDNRPHRTYFDYLTYEYIVHEERKHLAFQPISLFFNNIWDAPAPMRVIATGNSFWNIISSMRPHTLRNFASHSQPMDALVEMNFWSKRTIVEDGHQYWRSYFYFNGNYSVLPIYVPIYQDAVLSDTYMKTLKAQFIQLRRWAYGASDVAYVASRIFARNRNVPFLGSAGRLLRLLDGHVTLASVSLLIAFGGWVPLLVNSQAFRDPIVHQLPDVVGRVQQVATIGLFITVFLAFKLLPPRPGRYKRHRSIFMLAQWILMPVTAIAYSSLAAFNAQTLLLFGIYLDKFDVTDKATHDMIHKNK